MGRYVIKPAEGSRRSGKRIGRGIGSGYGKTAGKGTKGQKSRSGHKHRAWFEGGQMPLQRRIPKRGFRNIFRIPYQVVNLKDLMRVKGGVIDKEALAEAGLIRSAKKPVKLLGGGEVQKKLKVTVDAITASARRAIEDAGGSCTILRISRAPIKVRKARVERPVVAEQPLESEQPAEVEEPVAAEQPPEMQKQAEEEQPVEGVQPAGEEQPVEEVQPAEEEQPVEEEQPAEEEQPVEEEQPAEEEQPLGEVQAAEEEKPAGAEPAGEA